MVTISAVVGALVTLPPRGWRQFSWPQQARLAQPARMATVINILILSQVLIPASVIYFDLLGFAPPTAWLVTVDLFALLGAVGTALFMAWLMSPRRRPVWRWVIGCASALLFGYPNTLVYTAMCLAIYLLPASVLMLVMILIFGAMGMVFAAWGGGIWVARALGLARPALPRAVNAANWAGERVGVRVTAVYELLWPRVMVDSFSFSGYLVVTEAAAELLSDDELLGLSVREISFFKQPWLAGMLRVLDSTIIFFLLACVAISQILGRQALLFGVIAGWVLAILMRPLSRRAQIRADALAAQAAIDPRDALRALERQYELNLTPVVAISASSRDAHLYDRMVAAGIAPVYPRPQPPSKARIFLSLGAAAGACVVISITFLIIVAVAFRS
jgi:Zn-dependent protease with chaperone function